MNLGDRCRRRDMLVPNFTLLADYRRGNRPIFCARRPREGKRLSEYLPGCFRVQGMSAPGDSPHMDRCHPRRAGEHSNGAKCSGVAEGGDSLSRMKLIISGNINKYYVQTLCMLFFPASSAKARLRDMTTRPWPCDYRGSGRVYACQLRYMGKICSSKSSRSTPTGQRRKKNPIAAGRVLAAAGSSPATVLLGC